LFQKSGSIASFASLQTQVDAAALAYAQSKVATFGAASCIKNPATDALRAIWLCLGEDVGGVDSIFTAPGNFSGTGVAKCTWAIEGALPGGITFQDNGNGTAELKGFANELGVFNFTVKALSSAGDTYSTVKVTVSVLGFVTTSPMSAGNVCSDYYLQLQANGGVPSFPGMTGYKFAMNTSFPGSLPNGLSMISGGRIVGKPAGTGTSQFALIVTDSVGQQCGMPFSLTIGAPATVPSWTTGGGLPNGHSGNNYFQFIGVIAGCPPYTLSILSGSLPVSLHLGKTGTGDWAITGLPGPSDVGSYSFTLKATDSAGQSITQPFSLTIDTTTIAHITCPCNSLITASGSQASGNDINGHPYDQNALNSLASVNAFNNLSAAGCPLCPGCTPGTVHVTTVPRTNATTPSPNLNGTSVTQTCNVSCWITGNGIGGWLGFGPHSLGAIGTNFANNMHNALGSYPSGIYGFYVDGAHTQLLFTLYF
jgi:hypothetical protein